jgi:isopenicillin N synthase-like dioxygenase
MSTTALASTLGDITPPDLSESLNVGFYDEIMADAADSVDKQIMCWPNRWPDEPAALRPTFERYYATLRELATEILELLAIAVDMPPEWFVPPFAAANTSMLLMNYYPALTEAPRPGQLRRGAHTDYGIITLLYAEGEPGLQISVDGEWLDVPAVDGAFVVNLGDLMARWVNDRWRSTLHRVVVPTSDRAHADRISIPFFVHPDFDTTIETVPTTITADSPAQYDAVAGGPWIATKSHSMMETEDS